MESVVRQFIRLDKGFRLNDVFSRSKRTECPECRSKYTVRTLKKLFLHSELNKDDDDHFLQMQEEKERNVKLKSENDLVRAEKRKLEHDLLQTHNEYQNLQ